MTSSPVEPSAWSRRRWCGAITLTLIGQVGMIFWLGDRHSAFARKPASIPQIFLATDQVSELATLTDPTLFALANRHGFSGDAWLTIPPLKYQSADWTEPPRWLALQVEKLGETFNQFVQTNTRAILLAAEKIEPRITAEFSPAISLMATQSTLRIEGDLAGRPLHSPLELPSRPHTDVLANSVVQVVVDPDGYTASANLLASSGLKEADRTALELARSARFASIRGHGPERLTNTVANLSWGKLIFEWHTTAITATNTPPTSP